MPINQFNKTIPVAGIVLVIMSLLFYLANSTPIGVVLDLRWTVLILDLLGTSLCLSGLFIFSQQNVRMKWTGIATLGVAAIILVLMGRELFFVYNETEVTFTSGDISLSGTIYSPRGKESVQGVILVHGSGPETRNEYAYYARHFARNGIAALAYDKRGSGKSGGNTYETGYDGYAADALAAFRTLQNRPETDPMKTGIWGFSEGEWVVPQVASMTDSVAFIVMISASGRSPVQQVEYEMTADLRRAGFSSEAIDTARQVNQLLTAYLRTGEDRNDTLAGAIKRYKARSWFEQAGLPQARYTLEDYGWWRKVFDFQALEAWEQVSCPVLLVSGGMDTKSPVEDSQRRITAVLSENRNTDVTGVIFPKADHSLTYRWLPGDMPPPAFPSDYPDTVVHWVQNQFD